MLIEGKMIECAQSPETLDFRTKSGDIQTINVSEISIDDDLNFTAEDAYILGEICDDYEYETQCIDDLLEIIIEDFEYGITFDHIKISDDCGEVLVEYYDDEDAFQRKCKITTQWYRQESKESQDIDDNNDIKDTNDTQNITFEEYFNNKIFELDSNEDYFTLPDGTKHPSLAYIEKVSDSPTAAEKVIMIQKYKSLQQEQQKDKNKVQVKTQVRSEDPDR